MALCGCDVLVHAGDIGDDNVFVSLSAITDHLVAVVGNNDLFSRGWSVTCKQAQVLSESAELVLTGGTLVVEHGHRIHDTRHYAERLRDKYPQARMIVFGHTHQQMIDQNQQPWVVNPGAAGRARTHGGPGCLISSITGHNWVLESCRFETMRRLG